MTLPNARDRIKRQRERRGTLFVANPTPSLDPASLRVAREALGLTGSDFAAVLFVHPVTLYRWEGAERLPPICGVAGAVLPLLVDAVRLSLKRAAKIGKAVKRELNLHGPLAALTCLLNWIRNTLRTQAGGQG